MEEKFNKNTTIGEIINYKSFKNYGKYIFPLDINIPKNTRLDELNDYYSWYTLNTNRTAEVVNYLKDKADDCDKIFYDIYTDEEKRQDNSKENTGLFFFRGNKNNKYALVSAGGGFMYVGAMQDSYGNRLKNK